MHDAHPGVAEAARQDAVDEVHGDVLVGVRYQRQAGEDQHQQRELGDLEAAADRPVEQVARHHVGEGERHHAEEQDGGGHAEDGVGPPLPATATTLQQRPS